MRSFALAALTVLLVSPAVAQRSAENLQVFPTDMTRGEVIAEMRHFSFALGVRCEHCHVQRTDGPGFLFSSDEKPAKEKARVMMMMTESINKDFLTQLSDQDDPPVVVTCKTCHRGTLKPRLLWQDLLLTTHKEGAEAATDRLAFLEENYDNSGAYDFREWETNVVAEKLADEGNHEDAIVIWRMNAERFPSSDAIQSGMAESYEALGDTLSAIAAYERALELNSNRRDVRGRLAELKGE